MSILQGMKSITGQIAIAMVAASCFLAGCGQDGVSVQSVPKETAAPGASPAPMAGVQPAPMAAPPSVRWQRPSTWEEQPRDNIRLVSFIIKGTNGAQAVTTIIPLPGQAGTDLDNVNRWRGQVGLDKITEAEMKAQAQPVTVGNQAASLFDMTGISPDKSAKTRILATFVRQDGMSWFFKVTGDDELVAANKPVFVEFLKRIEFSAEAPADPHAGLGIPPALPATAPAAAPDAPMAASPEKAANAKWALPAHWKEQPPGPMQTAKFQASIRPEEKIEVTVSSLAGTGGDLLGNVNRWRGQIRLGPVAQTELSPLVATTNWHGAEFKLVTLENTANGLATCAVISSQKDETWFFKLSGQIGPVTREKPAFLEFVQSWKP